MKVRIPALLVGMSCVASNVSAADYKAFHAGRCQSQSYGYGSGLLRSASGGIYTSDDAIITCPLIRDRLESSTSLGHVEVEGYSGGSYEYTCELDSQTEDGSSGTTVDYDLFEVAGAGRVNETLDVVSSSGNTGGNEGSYSLTCVLPPGSSLYHIFVAESTASGSVD